MLKDGLISPWNQKGRRNQQNIKVRNVGKLKPLMSVSLRERLAQVLPRERREQTVLKAKEADNPQEEDRKYQLHNIVDLN